MSTELKVGMRVKYVVKHMNPLNYQTGHIIDSSSNHPFYHVKLDTVINGSSVWMMHRHNLYPLFTSPEEEAAYQEQVRQAEEKRLDQARRQAHANKYL